MASCSDVETKVSSRLCARWLLASKTSHRGSIPSSHIWRGMPHWQANATLAYIIAGKLAHRATRLSILGSIPLLCDDATRHQSEESFRLRQSRHLSKSVTSHCWSRGSPYSTTVAVPGFKLSLKVRTFCRLGLKPGRVYDKAFSCLRYHNYDNF